MTELHIIDSPLDRDASKTNYWAELGKRGWAHHPDGRHWGICIASKAVFYHPWIYPMTGSYRFASEEEAHAALVEMGWAK